MPCMMSNMIPAEPSLLQRYGFRLAPWGALALILLLAVGQLRLQGRLWWCECGQAYLWSSETASRHNSQHLLDPYWFTHVLHGIVFYWALTWAFPRLRL